jgi:hypothetical protein
MRRSAWNIGLPLRNGFLLAALVLLFAPHHDFHRAQQVGASFGVPRTLVSEGASHPNAPPHVESSPQTEEEPCASCLFSGQIGNGLLGAAIPQPLPDIRRMDFAPSVSSPLASARPGLFSRAPPAA